MAIRQGRGIARVDGNAVAGLLGEVFHGDITLMSGGCGACGATGLLASAVVELDDDGCIVLCRTCQHTLFTVIRRPDGIRITVGALKELSTAD